MELVNIGGQVFRKRPRVYSAQVARSNVAGASFPFRINIEPGFPFLLHTLHASDSSDTTTITAQTDFLVSLQDNESSYNWTDGLIPRACLFGAREFGNQLPDDVMIKGNTQLLGNIQNTGTTGGTLTIALRGWSLVPANQ